MKILVLGASGMLGSAMFRLLSDQKELNVYGTVRSSNPPSAFMPEFAQHILTKISVENEDAITSLLEGHRPDVVINCVGLIKQLGEADDPLIALPINAMLPHRLARAAAKSGARVVHFSTDCVFSGRAGNYLESDVSDATDLYGKSKYIGEVDYPNALTLRTSIIGHGLNKNHSLIDWFLSQTAPIKGYTKAIFSGLPTIEMSQIVRDLVLPNPALKGLYHVAAQPISKFDLLGHVAAAYQHNIDIMPEDEVQIDRSLCADKFNAVTGYKPPSWVELIDKMRAFQ